MDPVATNPDLVSVILPTYNRAAFLPQALAAIRSQRHAGWELIVIDDGSTDDTEAVVRRETAGWSQPVTYHKQANAGPYGARNAGLDRARGAYVAFYDSDDTWLPHHLSDCLSVMSANADVDWVYASCRVVDAADRELSPSTFYVDGQPRAFLSLNSREAGVGRVLTDPATLETMLTRGGLYAGLQNSLIRRDVFASRRFSVAHRDESEDVLFLVRFLAEGRLAAYIDAVHVNYRVHDANSTTPGGGSLEKRIRVFAAMLKGAEDLRAEGLLAGRAKRAYDLSLSRSYFWNYGYAILWQNGRRHEALAAYRRALTLYPWAWAYWKTYTLAVLKVWFTSAPAAEAQGRVA